MNHKHRITKESVMFIASRIRSRFPFREFVKEAEAGSESVEYALAPRRPDTHSPL